MNKRQSTLHTLIFLIAFGGTVKRNFALSKQAADSITVAVAPEYDQVSSSHRFWLGENYRKLWAAPVKIRILDLQKERGGLSIVKLGGGMQTRSLRFKDASGREWVLRTIQKYPERGLPANLRPTIARDILQDQVSTGHPFGALVVPPLAEALQLPHANPEVVYVGDDPGLDEYRNEFAGAVYLFEERAPFESEKTDNTVKTQRKVEEDNDTRVDQKLVLRARLLDILTGDWDRHEDNWRWIPEKVKDEHIYTPVPRDRDKVFYKTSGVFPWILSHQWLKSNLQPYSEKVRDISGWNYNARYFDRYFLNQLDAADWRKEIRRVQKIITDSLIEAAVRRMPDTIYTLGGEELIRIMKARRDNLEITALEYYRFLAAVVDVPASEKREFIDVDYRQNGDVRLDMYNKKKDGTRGRHIFRRTFRPEETDEVRVYGLAGNDVYTVKGEGRSAVRVRLIGGTDTDSFTVSNAFVNKPRLYVYDRSDRGDSFPPRSLAKLRLKADSSVNVFDREAFKYNRFGPMALINYNIDQGIQLRAGIIYERQGFRKDPYAVKHEFWANYSTGRNSYIFTYAGEFTKLVGENDLTISLNSWGPNNLSNFFGIGNETVFDRSDDKGISYYRNRYEYLTGDVRLNRHIGRRFRANAGLGAEFYTSAVTNNLSRFFGEFNVSHPEEDVFSTRFYAGAVAGLTYDSRDKPSMPSSGIYWNTAMTVKRQMNGENDSYASVFSELSAYMNVLDSNLVIANRIGAGTTAGDPAFFQRMQLGGVNSLRGFHTNRFTGKTMLFHNLDLRLKLFDFTSYLVPGSVGLLGFHDTGRVWVPGQSSQKWHHGYGGGIYIIPADLILIQGAVGFSKEGSLPYISLGFSF